MKIIVSLFIVTGLAFGGQAPVGFIFFGDWGTGTEDQIQTAKGMKHFCKKQLCEFGLLLGDNFYPDGVRDVNDPQFKTRFEEIYSPLGIQFFVALGNHDYHGNPQAQIEYTKKQASWHMPSPYYTFTQKAVQFFVLDTEQFNEAQLEWLKKAISRSNAQWKIVLGHHPIYSYGQHGNTQELQRKLLPELKGKVDYYLAGHDHDLQVIAKDGISFVVSGAAAKLRKTKMGSGSLFAQSKLGFSHLRIEGEKADLTILDANGDVLFQNSRNKTEDSTNL
jgi:tartrate-resistant acid phosphatase type 5